jgi:hypothetical protein
LIASSLMLGLALVELVRPTTAEAASMSQCTDDFGQTCTCSREDLREAMLYGRCLTRANGGEAVAPFWLCQDDSDRMDVLCLPVPE